MNAIIHAVQPESIAEALGLAPGDQVLAVNGKTDLEDMLDYQFELSDSVYLELTVRRNDGSEEIFEIEKDPDEDLGLVFTSPLFTPIRTCNNACPFCFIDQQPEGLRASLYVKDDDYRLSYFNNTYITLTNLTARDRARIERLRPGPLYISVHATDPAVRARLLVNPKARPVLEELRWLKGLEIPFHAQVVLCPGINDGAVLVQTLQDLATLRPALLSAAVVPVGLTQYRAHLPELRPVDAEVSRAVIEAVEALDFVHLSDEFYFKAGLPLPAYERYDGFPQLDDGVGTARMLLSDFYDLENTLPESLEANRRLFLLTGRLGAMILQPIASRLNQIKGLYLDVLPVENAFWGQSVDVAGLVTGRDIVETLKKHDATGYQAVLIPSVMLKSGDEGDRREFLDSLTVAEVSRRVGLPVVVVEDAYSASELLGRVLGELPVELPVEAG